MDHSNPQTTQIYTHINPKGSDQINIDINKKAK